MIRFTIKAHAAVPEMPSEVDLDQAEVLIGRDKSCELVLPEGSVSRSHARVTRDGALHFIEDVGSSAGTRVNGQLLPRAEKRLLRNGDVLEVGTFELTFIRLPDESGIPGGRERTGDLARAAVKDLLLGMGAGGQPFLRLMNGPQEGRRVEIKEGQELTIGRSDECDILFEDDLTSRLHARIRRDWAGTHVQDLESRNGVKVNARFIKGPTTLKDHDEVLVGETRLLYIDPSSVGDSSLVVPMTDPGMPELSDARLGVEKTISEADADRRESRVRSHAVVEASELEPPQPAPPAPEPPRLVSDPHIAQSIQEETGIEVLEKPPLLERSWDRLVQSLPPMPNSREELRRYLPLLVVVGVAIASAVLLVFVLVST